MAVVRWKADGKDVFTSTDGRFTIKRNPDPRGKMWVLVEGDSAPVEFAYFGDAKQTASTISMTPRPFVIDLSHKPELFQADDDSRHWFIDFQPAGSPSVGPFEYMKQAERWLLTKFGRAQYLAWFGTLPRV